MDRSAAAPLWVFGHGDAVTRRIAVAGFDALASIGFHVAAFVAARANVRATA